MGFKKCFAAVLLGVIVCTAASAQAPAYREQGYKGNAGLSILGYQPGIETTHGYMINSKHFVGGGIFIGGGIEGYFLMKEHIDYQWYIKDKKSTPVVVAQLGLFQTKDLEDGDRDPAENYLFVEPRFGWSWAIGERYGLTLTGGIAIVDWDPIPTISLVFEL